MFLSKLKTVNTKKEITSIKLRYKTKKSYSILEILKKLFIIIKNKCTHISKFRMSIFI